MKHSLHDADVLTRPARRTACALLGVLALACGDGGGGGGSANAMGGDGGDDGSGSTSNTPGNSIDEAVLAKCPQSSTLIETTEWMSCLEGKILRGTEPFNNTPCELRIGDKGVFEYVRDGVVAIDVPERSTWRSASGTYQNEAISGPRFFLASISPDLPAVEGEPRVTSVDVSLFSLDSQQDKAAVSFLDAELLRQTYNCTLDVL